MRASVRRHGAGVALLVLFVAGLGGAPSAAVAATPHPPAIAVSPTSGPPGESFVLTGDHLVGGTSYQVLICPLGDLAGTPCGYSGANLVGLSRFTALEDGTVPPGTTGRIPDLLAGPFGIEIIGASGVAASAPFDVLAPNLALTPTSGAAGAEVTIAGTGYGPGATYVVCVVAATDSSCGGVGIPVGEFTADAGGSVPASTSVFIPGSSPGTYRVGTFLKDNNAVFIASGVFTVAAPTLTLSASDGPAGMVLTAAGTGYVASRSHTICLVPAGATLCGGVGTYIGEFATDSAGSIPPGTVATIPAGSAPGTASIGILLTGSTPVLLVSVPFSITGGTPAPTATPLASTAPPSNAPTATPTPSGTTAPAAAGDGGGTVWLVLLIVLVVIVAGFLLWRRRASRATTA
jgi:hypothetical protein